MARPRITDRMALIATLGLAFSIVPAVSAQPRLVKDVYGVGIAGNCCTHGAGVCGMFTPSAWAPRIHA